MQIRCIELCCEKCKEEGKQAECVHMLHLVPVWQSEERHRKLKIMSKWEKSAIMLMHVLIIPQTTELRKKMQCKIDLILFKVS